MLQSAAYERRSPLLYFILNSGPLVCIELNIRDNLLCNFHASDRTFYVSTSSYIFCTSVNQYCINIEIKMASNLKGVYHAAAFGWYVFVVTTLAAKNGEELPPGIFVYGGPWKYLTFLNLLLQMVFFGLAAVNDLHHGKNSASTLNRCTDLMFSIFAFPVGMFVVVLFWTIFAYDRELVYPATIDAFLPPWTNHAMHTFVLPLVLGEFLVQYHAYPQTKCALATLGLVGLGYLFWIVWVYVSAGIWVYPLLGHFSAVGLVGFFCFNMSVVTLFYLLGDKLNSQVWKNRCNRY
ncbi:androgen-dependent TFPI-regulating protein isoform X1 [Syngnathoides biaculeatus]|uniref:androgen-dependent TFPI-regulating protein isoform X1 n=1 Tax=Syngnathoides biaculeatus TaxID=300417 RepID=UPI002ADD3999|nr:androgen-dependent TFPI-regulating protein isoform X1 [Syngnathoides biaculeatus]